MTTPPFTTTTLQTTSVLCFGSPALSDLDRPATVTTLTLVQEKMSLRVVTSEVPQTHGRDV